MQRLTPSAHITEEPVPYAVQSFREAQVGLSLSFRSEVIVMS